MTTAAAMCRPHASEASRPEAGSRSVGVRDVEGWRMPVPSEMSEQRTGAARPRSGDARICFAYYPFASIPDLDQKWSSNEYKFYEDAPL